MLCTQAVCGSSGGGVKTDLNISTCNAQKFAWVQKHLHNFLKAKGKKKMWFKAFLVQVPLYPAVIADVDSSRETL